MKWKKYLRNVTMILKYLTLFGIYFFGIIKVIVYVFYIDEWNGVPVARFSKCWQRSTFCMATIMLGKAAANAWVSQTLKIYNLLNDKYQGPKIFFFYIIFSVYFSVIFNGIRSKFYPISVHLRIALTRIDHLNRTNNNERRYKPQASVQEAR